MHEYMNEAIEVTVHFHGRKVWPKQIVWSNNEYNISHVSLVHATHEGRRRIFYFSVSDATNFFKLRFNTETLEWRLVELYTN